jgi:phage protein D
MTRRTRSFTQQSDEQVIRSIAQDHGLTARLDISGPTHVVLAQLNQSDLAFVRERARALDAELWMDDRTLHVAAHSRRRGPRAHLGLGRELISFHVLADLAMQRSSVVVTGWDVGAKRPLSERADDQSLGGELGSSDSGASVLRTALAERKETIAHAVPFASAEARAEAEAIFRRGARRFVRGRGTARVVDAKLRVGATVRIDGVGPLFSGDYYVAETTYRFDRRGGTRCDFTAERPGLGRPS